MRVVAEGDRMIDQDRANDPPTGRSEYFGSRFSFRPAEVRHQNRLRAVFAQIIDRRQTFANPRVIGDDDFAVALFQSAH